MNYKSIESNFTNIGAEFLIPVIDLSEKLNKVKAFLFDWDGVFNNGSKGVGATSLFTEPDSMGTNLLRLGFWLKNNHSQPFIGIITALNNESALQMSEREHFNAAFFNFKNKIQAFDFVCQKYNLKPEEIAFVFDDVLDLSVAQVCGVRILIRRKASPLMVNYIKQNKLADYITGNSGNEYGVREACEMILGLTDMFDNSVAKRIAFDAIYQKYWEERNKMKLEKYIWKDDQILIDSH